MKKLIFVLLFLVLFTSIVLVNSEETQQTTDRIKAKNLTQLSEIIQQKQQEMNQEMNSLTAEQQLVYQNQNRVMLAVHSLLAMEDLVGGIGENVSVIAREFNNSIQATIRAEERIERRSAFTRFFAGGDEVAAEEIEQETTKNEERIQQLRGLMNDCDCSPEIRNRFQEQIQNIETEQNRQGVLAQKEKDSKGLFGWLWK